MCGRTLVTFRCGHTCDDKRFCNRAPYAGPWRHVLDLGDKLPCQGQTAMDASVHNFHQDWCCSELCCIADGINRFMAWEEAKGRSASEDEIAWLEERVQAKLREHEGYRRERQDLYS